MGFIRRNYLLSIRLRAYNYLYCRAHSFILSTPLDIDCSTYLSFACYLVIFFWMRVVGHVIVTGYKNLQDQDA